MIFTLLLLLSNKYVDVDMYFPLTLMIDFILIIGVL